MLSINILLALCSTSIEFKKTSACDTLAKAIYYQYNPAFEEIDNIEKRLQRYITPELRQTAFLVDALVNQRIYIQFINKSF